ncbi:hypothetical protein AMTRI_Chr13g85420 [Amborella trichopoda]|uniref:DUF3511 domain-containing protein n=1 Tax=Amborella trichopoda TaxID=13333 RepID=W1P8K0_AMBTC|nr:hypothetical protein AMTR_s00079p00164570 [Amborella trichopoda]
MADHHSRTEMVNGENAPSANGHGGNQVKLKSKSSSGSKSWRLSDPEVKRRKRVAGYKVYAVEGRVKASFRKSFRWIKDKCSDIIHGW